MPDIALTAHDELRVRMRQKARRRGHQKPRVHMHKVRQRPALRDLKPFRRGSAELWGWTFRPPPDRLDAPEFPLQKTGRHSGMALRQRRVLRSQVQVREAKRAVRVQAHLARPHIPISRGGP